LRARVIASGLSPATLTLSNSSHERAAPSRRPLSIATAESSSAQNSPSTETTDLPRRSLTPVISGKAYYRPKEPARPSATSASSTTPLAPVSVPSSAATASSFGLSKPSLS
jgi:hypothetical protein